MIDLGKGKASPNLPPIGWDRHSKDEPFDELLNQEETMKVLQFEKQAMFNECNKRPDYL
jgi:hypothetical protein